MSTELAAANQSAKSTPTYGAMLAQVDSRCGQDARWSSSADTFRGILERCSLPPPHWHVALFGQNVGEVGDCNYVAGDSRSFF